MRFMRLRAPSVSDSCHSAASEAKDLFGLGCPSVRSFDGREPTKAAARIRTAERVLEVSFLRRSGGRKTNQNSHNSWTEKRGPVTQGWPPLLPRALRGERLVRHELLFSRPT